MEAAKASKRELDQFMYTLL